MRTGKTNNSSKKIQDSYKILQKYRKMETINRKNEDGTKKTYQAQTLTSLAAKYKVSVKTFRNWIKPIEHEITIAHRRPFSPLEI